MAKHKQLIYANHYQGYEYYIEKSNKKYFAYILIIPKEHGYKYPRAYQKSTIDCHGGITYDDYDSNNNRLVGFNTNHKTDYPINKHGHKWTLDQLKFQCKSIIDQIRKIDD